MGLITQVVSSMGEYTCIHWREKEIALPEVAVDTLGMIWLTRHVQTKKGSYLRMPLSGREAARRSTVVTVTWESEVWALNGRGLRYRSGTAVIRHFGYEFVV